MEKAKVNITYSVLNLDEDGLLIESRMDELDPFLDNERSELFNFHLSKLFLTVMFVT